MRIFECACIRQQAVCSARLDSAWIGLDWSRSRAGRLPYLTGQTFINTTNGARLVTFARKLIILINFLFTKPFGAVAMDIDTDNSNNNNNDIDTGDWRTATTIRSKGECFAILLHYSHRMCTDTAVETTRPWELPGWHRSCFWPVRWLAVWLFGLFGLIVWLASLRLSFILLNRITNLSCEMSTVKRSLIVNFTFIIASRWLALVAHSVIVIVVPEQREPFTISPFSHFPIACQMPIGNCHRFVFGSWKLLRLQMVPK